MRFLFFKQAVLFSYNGFMIRQLTKRRHDFFLIRLFLYFSNQFFFYGLLELQKSKRLIRVFSLASTIIKYIELCKVYL